MNKLDLSPQVFAILGSLVEQETGIHYSPADREIFRDKLSDLVLAAGFDSFLDYYYFLRYDERGREALSRLTDALVVNESYFFRELAPLEIAVDEHLAPLSERGVRPRVWSAACAAGEEPLTLAMLLDARGLARSVDVLASDLSQRALARAQQGVYSPRALRDVRPPALRPYLRHGPDGRIAVRDDLRARIEWRCVNLIDPAQVAGLGSFDLILCRNVLIYFSDSTARAVLNTLGRALRPNGVLLVGVSESLLRFGTGLSCEERSGAFLYRKEAA